MDRRPPTGRPRLSPHALMQEYLNRSEHLWGVVTNGRQLRLLRDSALMTRPSYVEFDLEQMLDGEHFADFAMLHRLVHRSRLPQTYRDLQPKFLRELRQARHEKLPELSDILEENFLQDGADRWYVPNPERGEDLKKMRERSRLREFQECGAGGTSCRSSKLRVSRTEAVRAGFKHAWG